MILTSYLQQFAKAFPELSMPLWTIPQHLGSTLEARIKQLNTDYIITGTVAIHKTAKIEDHAIIKGPAIISEGCFIGAHAYLRGGVFLGAGVVIGPGCEVKTSILIGSGVNLEAGAVIANHYNERQEKEIAVMLNGIRTLTGSTKFGALVGDFSKIGANAVLSPGTILPPHSIVKRLALVEQCP
jgi:UDP-N-acetylglucosamine diphosphorylase / glucose-1-phosphate thymidylyltransferase / UDP-N-acetylgalactosamine diphosphorylase / glucosamine-1-phosphate N-acetyltransferase / galactosamine-1-phosphate N-acetyltransferase